MIDIRGKKVIVTGANSMIGRSVIKELQKREAIIDPVYHEECDLLNYEECLSRFKKSNPDFCIHAAGYNGNISFNRKYPADIFFNTTIMGLNTLNACTQVGVKKIVTLLENKPTSVNSSGNTIKNINQIHKLKLSVLKKAFSGKLIPQNSDDESVDILLEKIKQGKEQLIKKQKPSRWKKNVK